MVGWPTILQRLATTTRRVNILQITQNFKLTVLREFWELGEPVVCGCEKELEVCKYFSADTQIATSLRHFSPSFHCNRLL